MKLNKYPVAELIEYRVDHGIELFKKKYKVNTAEANKFFREHEELWKKERLKKYPIEFTTVRPKVYRKDIKYINAVAESVINWLVLEKFAEGKPIEGLLKTDLLYAIQAMEYIFE